ncbi:hypothetical protein [Lactococcus lactis]|uniref:Uncharacterized protein n=1 Tax=Lactococcus lactis TaxID=1358 RepID=A0AAW5TNX8_9LACT|nr:hypothetical protein [Lactococcus lactis]MCW2281032.1 hypothetical protein [Lactococcus lactis]
MSRDALWFSKVNSSPLAFAIKRYETWSSRFWIEGAVLVASKHLFIFFLITIISLFLYFVIIFNCVVLLDDMIEFNKNKDKIVVKKISE